MGGELGNRVDVHPHVNAMAYEYGWLDRVELPEFGMAL
jgi:hypothetical protein